MIQTSLKYTAAISTGGGPHLLALSQGQEPYLSLPSPCWTQHTLFELGTFDSNDASLILYLIQSVFSGIGTKNTYLFLHQDIPGYHINGGIESVCLEKL